MFNPKHVHIREDTFLLGGGGGSGPGLRRGGSLVNFLQIGKGQTCFFVFQPGEGHSFLARKNYSMSLLFCSVQAKLPVKINLNYLQVSKIYISKNYLLLTNIIVSLDPCPLSPIFWCFRVGFCDLLLLKPRELATGAFCQSRNNGESVSCRDKWSKRTGRILAEYYLRIQYIRPLGSGTTLGLHLSTSLNWHFYFFPQPMCHQQSQRSSAHPFAKKVLKYPGPPPPPPIKNVPSLKTLLWCFLDVVVSQYLFEEDLKLFFFALTEASVSLKKWWPFCYWWPNQCGAPLSDLT